MLNVKLINITLLASITLLTASCVRNNQVGGVDTFTTKTGKKVVITCIKHASLEINYDGYEIEVDPVASAYRPIMDYNDKPKADCILLTHEHYDHFDMNAIFLLTKDDTQLLLTPRCFGRYHRGTIIRNGDMARLTKDITVYAVPAYNTTPQRREIHPKNVGNGYIIDLGGFRVYVAGDTEFIPETRKIKDIDVAFLPCDQPKTMTPVQLRQAAIAIRPRVLYPYHMGQTDSAKIMRAVSGLGIDVRMRYMK